MKPSFTINAITLLSLTLILGCSHASLQIETDPVENAEIDIHSAAKHLSEAVKIRTISYSDTARTESAAFDDLNDSIKSFFPLVHGTLVREIINEYSLLYTWTGTHHDLKPVILLAHTDVVPADTSSLSSWKTDPFAGTIQDGVIWGRGTLDDKLSVFGIFEAVEFLLKRGYQPERSVLIAIGHDEEIGGEMGAAHIVAELKKRGVKADMVLDEGGVIVDAGVPGVKVPVALVGIAEKGYLSLLLSAEGVGGHSSMPPKKTAIGALSHAIVDLQENPLPSALDGPVREMLVTLAPETSFPYNFLFSNLWLFGGILESQLAASPKSNALIRTTIAPTMIQAGVKDNVLPSKAEAVVNFRLKPGDTVEAVIAHVNRVIDNLEITVSIYGNSGQPASTISNYRTDQFSAVAKSIRQTFPEALVSPYISVGGTDAKHYEEISENIYRFTPVLLSSERLDGLHGVDERITTIEYQKLVSFYIQVISNSTGSQRLW
ncbi:MAG: M20/M25/M40 family metallo-hydrolase [Candidatus Marinimicrobia bacterium]|nr:M20/M25/M40 family metallo-hydrolase [Candidatus Neomarinimicrobiota bacterium]